MSTLNFPSIRGFQTEFTRPSIKGSLFNLLKKVHEALSVAPVGDS